MTNTFRRFGESVARAVLYTPENKEQERSPEERLQQVLDHHIVDIRPRWVGEKSRKVSDSFAAFETEIHRCDPKLEIPHFVIERGKSVVLVGPNGSGKSTLFDGVMGRSNAHFTDGSYGYGKGVHGKETIRIARLDQEEILGAIDDLEAYEVLELAIERFKAQFPVDWEDMDAYDQNMENQEAQQRIEELIGRIGDLFELDTFMDRRVSELSGGERTKMTLLMVLASEPDVLLLDEPTNHLDLESISKLMGIFDLYTKAGIAVVCVSHVEWFLEMVGRDGTIELSMDRQKRQCVSSTSSYKKFKKREQRAPVIRGAIEWNQEHNLKLLHTQPFMAAGRITVKDSPLRDVRFPTITGSDITAFMGKNGTGKTKLLDAMAERSSGAIDWESGLQVAYMPQFWPEDVAEGSLEVFYNWVKDGVNPHSTRSFGRFTKELRDRGFVGDVRNINTRPLSSFSGGEQRLLWFLAASILEGTDMLLLDEPTNHMDQQTMQKIVKAIREFPGGVVLSTHDLRLMEELEADPGKNRQGRGVRNIVFEREGDQTVISESNASPIDYARETIQQSRKRGKRLKMK